MPDLARPFSGAPFPLMDLSVAGSEIWNVHVLDFRHVALFPNQSASNATGVENQSQISDFPWPQVKLKEGVGRSE